MLEPQRVLYMYVYSSLCCIIRVNKGHSDSVSAICTSTTFYLMVGPAALDLIHGPGFMDVLSQLLTDVLYVSR